MYNFKDYWSCRFGQSSVKVVDTINVNNRLFVNLSSVDVVDNIVSDNESEVYLVNLIDYEVYKSCTPIDEFKYCRKFSSRNITFKFPHVKNLFLQVKEDKILCVRQSLLNTWDSFDVRARINTEEFLNVCRLIYLKKDYINYINQSSYSIGSVKGAIKFGIRDNLVKKINQYSSNLEDVSSRLKILRLYGEEYYKDEIAFYNKYSELNRVKVNDYSRNLKRRFGGDFIEENIVRDIVVKVNKLNSKLEKELQELMNVLDSVNNTDVNNLTKLVNEERVKLSNSRSMLRAIASDNIQEILRLRQTIISW